MTSKRRWIVAGVLAVGLAGAFAAWVLQEHNRRNDRIAEFRRIAAQFEPPPGFEVSESYEQRGDLCIPLIPFSTCQGTAAIDLRFVSEGLIPNPCGEVVKAVRRIAEITDGANTCAVDALVNDVRVRAVVSDQRGSIAAPAREQVDQYKLYLGLR